MLGARGAPVEDQRGSTRASPGRWRGFLCQRIGKGARCAQRWPRPAGAYPCRGGTGRPPRPVPTVRSRTGAWWIRADRHAAAPRPLSELLPRGLWRCAALILSLSPMWRAKMRRHILAAMSIAWVPGWGGSCGCRISGSADRCARPRGFSLSAGRYQGQGAAPTTARSAPARVAHHPRLAPANRRSRVGGWRDALDVLPYLSRCTPRSAVARHVLCAVHVHTKPIAFIGRVATALSAPTLQRQA